VESVDSTVQVLWEEAPAVLVIVHA
jgi:hypothetical protein